MATGMFEVSVPMMLDKYKRSHTPVLLNDIDIYSQKP